MLENNLKDLINGNEVISRKKIAAEYKRQGKKIIGLACCPIPEEIIYAAGMLPWHISGTWQTNAPQASAYRLSNTCPYCTHVLESLLTGELDFLDGIVFTDIDYELVRLYDVFAHLKKIPSIYILHLPKQNKELTYRFFAEEINGLISFLEGLGGNKISHDSIRQAVNIYNEKRGLLQQVYNLRKKLRPPLSGTEVFCINTTAGVMSPDKFNEQMRLLLPYIEKREADLKHMHPRLLVSSDMLDNPSYFKEIENTGCLIAMDDLDNGGRHINQMPDIESADIIYSLSKYYLNSVRIPRTRYWDDQIDQVINWVKEYKIDGVIDLPQIYCQPRIWRSPYFERKMREADIPFVSIEREYHFANIGQFTTRIGAFLEMIG